jgi:DNA invertase Pin-like site-specific DNA recombinase
MVVCEIIVAEGKWVSYLRVSTGRQGRSGLGLEAQRKAVDDFLNGGRWRLIKEFVEVESGKKSDRPVLAEAIKACRVHGAKLVIAKIDRLSRDAHFLLGLEKAGVDFVAAEMPNANRLTVGIMAMIAEEERRMISARTKAGLAAAKRRGVKLGGYRAGANLTAQARKAGQQANARIAKERAADIGPVIAELQAAGAKSLRAIAAALNERGIPTARGTGNSFCHTGCARAGAALMVAASISTKTLTGAANTRRRPSFALCELFDSIVHPWIGIDAPTRSHD